MAEVRSYKVGACWVHVNRADQCVVVEFPDKQRAIARPVIDEESIARAEALGYKGPNAVRDMTVEHDPAHCIVALLKGVTFSPVLRWVATGADVSEWAKQTYIQWEESAALQLQADLNAGIDNDATRLFLSTYKGRLT